MHDMATLTDELAMPEYAALSDAAAAAAINAKTVPVVGTVTQAWLLAYLGAQGMLLGISEVADGTKPAPADLRNACLACMTYLRSGLGAPFDCSDASNAGMMAGLVSAGLLQQSHIDAVVAHATTQDPYWQSLDVGRPVHAGDVHYARGGT